MLQNNANAEIEVILGNSNSRFSGVTSTMLQTLAVQKKMMGIRVMGQHHLPEPSLAISFWQTVKLCQKPLNNGQPRVFHARRNDEMIQALILKIVFGCKLRIVFTSTAQRFHSGFTKFLMSKMDAIISTCDAAASYLDCRPDTIIHHGVDAQLYHPTENKDALFKSLGQELGFSGSKGIGIFGRVREQKGVHLFVRAAIEAFKTEADYSAIIVGAISADNQAFVDQLKKEVHDNNLQERIVFLGEQPFNRLPELIRSVHVLAALSDNEGFGLTPLEALASGTAVLTTTAGAWPEIVENDVNGYIVDINDQAAVTQRLKDLLASTQRLEDMAKKGRQQIENKYTVEQEAQALCDFYKHLQSA